MKNILLIGLGRFGRHMAEQLNQMGHEIMAVDLNEERVEKVLPFVTNAQIGDCTDADYLRSLGIRNYDICFVAIGGSFQNSLETTSLLKELGADVTLTLYDHVIGYDEGSDLIHTYSGHWSWVYALNNDPTNDKGQSLFEWIAEQTLANDEDSVVNPDENEPVVKPDEKDPVETNPSNNVTQQPSGDQPTDVDNNQTVSVPNTGDHLNVVLPVTLLVLSAAIGYVVLRKRKEC